MRISNRNIFLFVLSLALIIIAPVFPSAVANDRVFAAVLHPSNPVPIPDEHTHIPILLVSKITGSC